MSTKYLVKSAEVLNEADRFSQILDWELFASEQEARLYGYDGKVVTPQWIPGMPIYSHPQYIGLLCDCSQCAGRNPEGYTGNYVRPMIQEYLDGTEHYQRVKCETCEVSGAYEDTECWFCGVEYPALMDTMRMTNRFSTFESYWGGEPLGWTNRDGVVAHVERVSESIRGLSVDMIILDEAAPMLLYGDGFGGLTGLPSPQPWVTGEYGFHNPFISETNVFEKPNIRGPSWGTAVLYDRLDDTGPGSYMNQGLIPRDWATLKRDVPMPVLPEPPDYSDWKSRGVRLWAQRVMRGDRWSSHHMRK